MVLFDRLGKILTILILTLDRKVTMIPLTSVKLGIRCVHFLCNLLLLFMSVAFFSYKFRLFLLACRLHVSK